MMIKKGVSNDTLIETYLKKYSIKDAMKYLEKEGIHLSIEELRDYKDKLY